MFTLNGLMMLYRARILVIFFRLKIVLFGFYSRGKLVRPNFIIGIFWRTKFWDEGQIFEEKRRQNLGKTKFCTEAIFWYEDHVL